MRSVEILREEMVKLFAEIITMKGHFQGVKPHRNVSICENVQRRAMFFSLFILHVEWLLKSSKAILVLLSNGGTEGDGGGVS